MGYEKDEKTKTMWFCVDCNGLAEKHDFHTHKRQVDATFGHQWCGANLVDELIDRGGAVSGFAQQWRAFRLFKWDLLQTARTVAAEAKH